MFNMDLKESVKKILQYLLPEMRNKFAFPIKAKVLRVYTQENRYKCDVLPLRNNNEEIGLQVIKEVEINSITNGNYRGFFALPEEGSIVRVSFYGGDFNFPFVDAVLFSKTPALERGEIAIYRDKNCFISMKADRTISINTSGNVEVVSSSATIKANKVNLGGLSGVAIARKGDQVKVGDQYGTIISGSSKVFSE